MILSFRVKVAIMSILLVMGISACTASETIIPTETVTPSPISTCETTLDLTQTPTPELDTLKLGSSIFIQEDTELLTAFLLTNLDETYTYYNIEYTVLAYDSNGATVGNDTAPIDFILPGQTIGAVSNIWLEAGVVVEKVDVVWTYSIESNSNFKSPFLVSKTRFIDDLYFDVLTGVIKNDSKISYSDLRINALAFDENGGLVGGGIGNVDILPGKSEVGVNVYGTVADIPATVLFFPTQDEETASYEDGNWRNNLKIMDFGFVQNDLQVGGGFLLKNLTDQVIENSRYTITIYESDGSVSNVDSGYIDFIFPGETLGISPGAIPLFSESQPAEVDVTVLPGDFSEPQVLTNPLISEKIEFFVEDTWPKASVSIGNRTAFDISNIFVHVLLFDEKGNIIGGGTAFPKDVGALGSVEIVVPLTHISSDPPARIEAYPVITTWSEFTP